MRLMWHWPILCLCAVGSIPAQSNEASSAEVPARNESTQSVASIRGQSLSDFVEVAAVATSPNSTQSLKRNSESQKESAIQFSSEETFPIQGTWDSKTKSPPSPSCPTCCRGPLKEACPGEEMADRDPCADASVCSGFHRCYGAKRGFLQCQPKPDSDVLCQTGPNCLPECVGKKLGNVDDDCALQPIENCEGYVLRWGHATQCRVKPGGNPSGADICANAHFCGER